MSANSRNKMKSKLRSTARKEKKAAIISGTYTPKIKAKKMLSVYARASCGCCEVEMKFHSIQRAAEVFADNDLQVMAEIVDDAGNVHDDVDTFYGFSTDSEEMSGRSLGYLAKRAGFRF